MKCSIDEGFVPLVKSPDEDQSVLTKFIVDKNINPYLSG